MKTVYEELREERQKLQKEEKLPEWFTTNGYQLFKEKYLWDCNNFKEQAKRIAKVAASHTDDPKGWRKKFFDMIWNGHLALATPVLANMGTTRGCPVSCSGGYVEDSIKGFYEARTEAALLSKYGFGTSAYLGDIRARGSAITSGGKSSGVLPEFKAFVQTSRDVNQGGVRRGAWAGYMELDHPDFWEVITYLVNNPDDANIGWIVTEKFINRLQGGDSEALAIYQRALKVKCTIGKGYFWFVDKVNDARPECYKHYGRVNKASNLCTEIALSSDVDHTYTCQPGFAKVYKKDIGICEFSEISTGDYIWSNEGWTKVINKISSGVKKVNSYYTNSGRFIGTEDHRVVEKGVKKEVKEVEGIDVCFTSKDDFNNILNIKLVLEGLMLGDGTIRNNVPQLCVGEKDYDYYKSEIQDLIENTGYKYFRKLKVNYDKKNLVNTYERVIPKKLFSTSKSNIASFLRGLFSANGSVLIPDYYPIVTLTQSSRELIYEVQELLYMLGIDSKIYKQKGKEVEFWNGKCTPKDTYRLKILTVNSVKRFNKYIGFLQKYKTETLSKIEEIENTISKPRKTSKIYEKEYLGNHEVFHIEVDNKSHTYWTSGCNVSNCILSSLNLTHWPTIRDNETIFTATVFLDCVASEFIRVAKGIQGLENAVRYTEKSRALGLGTLGFHTYLQQNNIAFEELRAHFENTEIFKQISEQSLEASKWMAKKFGEPEWCKGFGLRNTHRIAIAPNMSSSLICGGVSQGIEPIFQNVYTQGSAGGEMHRINPVLLKIMKERGVYNEDVIKDIGFKKGSVQHVDWLDEHEKLVFKTAFEIDQRALLRLASTRQKYICQAQSLNLFFAADEDEAYISEIHKEAFLDPNIKSLYYLRSSSGIQASKGECIACEG